MTKLLANRIMTPDGTILQSYHRHDYKEYVDTSSNELYILDGGLDYIRCSVNKISAKNLHIYTTDSHDDIREAFAWGTYGIKGDQKRSWIVLKNIENNHIQAILDTQKNIPDHIRKIFIDEQEYRINNKMTV